MSSYNKCGVCKEKGHNVRTCKKNTRISKTSLPASKRGVPKPQIAVRRKPATFPNQITSNVQKVKESDVITEVKNAIGKKQFRKANKILVNAFENSKNPDAFLDKVLRNSSSQIFIANQFLDYKGSKTPSSVLHAIKRSDVPFSLKARAVHRLYNRKEVLSTFTFPSGRETLEAKKTLEDYINYDWREKGYACPQPHICKVEYHKPKQLWEKGGRWSQWETPKFLNVNEFNTALELNRKKNYDFPNFFNKEQVACPFIIENACVAHDNLLASPVGATGALDVTSVYVDYDLKGFVEYETVPQDDGPNGYYSWEEVVNVKLHDSNELPQYLASHFFRTVLPTNNLVDNIDLDVYALTQSLKFVSGLDNSDGWRFEIEDAGGPYWDPEVKIKPARHFINFERKFYINFFSKNSNGRMVEALKAEYDNLPEYVKVAKFSKEKLPISTLMKSIAQNGEEVLAKKPPLDETMSREQIWHNKVVAVVYQKDNGEIEFIDGRERLSEALGRGLKEVAVIVGRSG